MNFCIGGCGDMVTLGFVPRPNLNLRQENVSSIAMKKPTDNVPQETSTNSILEGIKKGEEAIKKGNVLTHAQVKEKMRKWLKS